MFISLPFREELGYTTMHRASNPISFSVCSCHSHTVDNRNYVFLINIYWCANTSTFCSKGHSIFMLVAMHLCEVQNMSQTGFTNVTCHLRCCKPQQTGQTTVLVACCRMLEMTKYCSSSHIFMLWPISYPVFSFSHLCYETAIQDEEPFPSYINGFHWFILGWPTKWRVISDTTSVEMGKPSLWTIYDKV